MSFSGTTSAGKFQRCLDPSSSSIHRVPRKAAFPIVDAVESCYGRKKSCSIRASAVTWGGGTAASGGGQDLWLKPDRGYQVAEEGRRCGGGTDTAAAAGKGFSTQRLRETLATAQRLLNTAIALLNGASSTRYLRGVTYMKASRSTTMTGLHCLKKSGKRRQHEERRDWRRGAGEVRVEGTSWRTG
jgi:hypothetical protein